MSIFSNTRTLLKIGFVANVFEAYEFSMYGFLVPVIGQLFLQATDPESLYIQSYLLFAVSFLARPMGSVLWGYLADRIGRSRTLKITLLVMSIPTTLIGVLPTYDDIGMWATVSFLVLRFLQGFSMGGEQAISACYVYEAAPVRYRSVLCSVVGASSIIGMLAASCVALLLFKCFDEATLLQWGWRLPYLFGIFITLWIARMRRSMQETYHLHPKTDGSAQSQLTRQEKINFIKRLVPVVLLGGFMQICAYTLFVWMPSYLSHFLGIEPAMAQFCNTVGFVLWVGFILLAGYLSSLYGYRRLIMVHTAAMVVMIIPLFKLLEVGTYGALLTAFVLFAWLHSALSAVMMEILGDTFPQKVRGFGMSLAQNLSVTVFGGTVGLLNGIVITRTGLLIFPALYIAITGFMMLAVVYRLRDAEQQSL